jgi:excinuclease ABC subunit B
VVKEVRDLTDRVKSERGEHEADGGIAVMPREEITRLIKELQKEMKSAAAALEFEKAAVLRDQIADLRAMAEAQDEAPAWKAVVESRW